MAYRALRPLSMLLFRICRLRGEYGALGINGREEPRDLLIIWGCFKSWFNDEESIYEPDPFDHFIGGTSYELSKRRADCYYGLAKYILGSTGSSPKELVDVWRTSFRGDGIINF